MTEAHSVTTSAPDADGRRTAKCVCGKSKTSSYGPVLDSWRKQHYRDVAREMRPLSLVAEDTSL